MQDRPKVKQLLQDGTYLVVTRNGRTFKYDPATGTSQWYTPEGSTDVLLLLARARGFNAKAQVEAGDERSENLEPIERPDSIESDPLDFNAVEKSLDPKAVERDGTEAEPRTDPNREPEPEEPQESQQPEPEYDLDFESDSEPEEFVSLLVEKANPHVSWELQRDALIADPRYEARSSNSKREQAFAEWAKTAAATAAVTATSSDGLVELIHANYNPRMFYTDFKRKFRADPAFNCGYSDKDRERLFREYAMMAKKSLAQRQELLAALQQNKDPASLESDPRYKVLKAINE